jgi:hypothetical protein
VPGVFKVHLTFGLPYLYDRQYCGRAYLVSHVLLLEKLEIKERRCGR